VDILKFDIKYTNVKVIITFQQWFRKGTVTEIQWSRIIRVCFLGGDMLKSDQLYIFTDERPESYVIPMDADGAPQLWDEIITRGLFDAELAIKAAMAMDGDLLCWPEEPQEV
jgi:hypothetical protein